jgi:thymidylate synthase
MQRNMALIDHHFNHLLKTILSNGEEYTNARRGVTRLEIPTYSFSYDMKGGFPILTTKEVHFKSVVTELLWFLRGDQTIDFLHQHGVKIWDKDAERYGKGNYIGFGYGWYWARQIPTVLASFKRDHRGSRHVVQAFHEGHHLADTTALPPCHTEWQLIGRNGGFDLRFTMRSWDVFLGGPFNIASYALLGKLIEEQTGRRFLNLHVQANCVHLYDNQIDAAISMVKAFDGGTDAPDLILEELPEYENGTIDITNVMHWTPDMIKLDGYFPQRKIKVKML